MKEPETAPPGRCIFQRRDLFHRKVQLISSGVLDSDVIPAKPVHFNRSEAQVPPDAVDTLYHIVSLFQIGKEADLLPLPGAPDAPSELGRPQNIAGCIERQLQRWEFKAFADNALRQPYAAFFRPVRNKKVSLPQRGSDLFLFRWICADNADPPALIQVITQLIAEKRKLTLEICHCSSFPRPLAMDMDIRQFSVQQRKNKCFPSPAPCQLLPVRAVLPVFFFFPKIFFQFFLAALRFVENNKSFPRIGNEAVLFNRIRMEREHKNASADAIDLWVSSSNCRMPSTSSSKNSTR